MALYREQRVVCINDRIPEMECLPNAPKKDCVYRIRDIVTDSVPVHFDAAMLWLLFDSSMEAGVLLYELRNPACACHGGTELGFPVSCFRPLVEEKKSTDISDLERIAREATVRITEKV